MALPQVLRGRWLGTPLYADEDGQDLLDKRKAIRACAEGKPLEQAAACLPPEVK